MNTRIRIDLLAVKGQMTTLVLPPVREGRYRFADRAGVEMDLPFDIAAEKGRWFLRASGSTALHRGDEELHSPAELGDEDLIGLSVGDRHYILFAEPEREKDNMFVPYRIPREGTISIGRETGNDICYENSFASRR